jgi:hypothetical protein
MRAETTVIATNKSFHFTDGKLQGDDVWFPIANNKSLFESVEEIMTSNDVAHNVIRLETIRDMGSCQDIKVIYNLLECEVK